MIQRFSGTVRAVHWSFGVSFLLLLATGFLLFVPQLKVMPYPLGSHKLFRDLHIFLGLVFLYAPLLAATLADWSSVWADVRETVRFGRTDWAWLAHQLRLGRAAPPARKFNAGQKLNTIFSVLVWFGFIASGLAMWSTGFFSHDQRAEAFLVHDALVVLSLPLVIGHLYLALIHPRTRTSLTGMVTGRVTPEWAREHHAGWDPRTRS
jgi:formate dehydrogenase subunit gamma